MKTNHKPGPRGAELTRVTSVLTPRLVERLDTIATQRTMSRSLIIRQACEQFLRKIEQGEQSEATANA